MTRSKRASGRLSITDWLDAALDLLIREGVGEVKISTLCDELGVTKGSFYWHFEDINALMNSLADHWTSRQVEAFGSLSEVQNIPAEQRLERMAGLLVERNWSVEAAIRDWAHRNARVADSVRDLDQRIFGIVRDALIELGFDDRDAGVRAGLLVYAGIGFIHGRSSLPTPKGDEIHAIVEVVVGRPTR